MTTQGNGVEPVPGMAHSCVQASGEYADPAVRIQQWAQGFGDRGLFETICADNFAPALSEIGQTLVGALEQPGYL